jgi:pilus assembly protein Flp/PilA
MNMLQNLLARLAVARSDALSRLRPEDGQTLVEYALILVFIAIVVIGALIALQGQITSAFNTVAGDL